jgi:hypothetical protein
LSQWDRIQADTNGQQKEKKKYVKYFMFEELDGFLWVNGLLLELRNRA